MSHFSLGVSHLFDRYAFAFALLAFDDALGGDAGLAVLGIFDDQLHEFGVLNDQSCFLGNQFLA